MLILLSLAGIRIFYRSSADVKALAFALANMGLSRNLLTLICDQ